MRIHRSSLIPLSVAAAIGGGCTGVITSGGTGDLSPDSGSSGDVDGNTTQSDGGDVGPPGDGGPPLDPSLSVRLVPASGQSGSQVVNFAIPLPQGLLRDASLVRVAHGGTDLPAYRRGLAHYADGSLRSVQVQVQVTLSGETTLDVAIGESGGGNRDAVAVTSTLLQADGTTGPKVWALLPANWMSASGVFGVLTPDLGAWSGVCDYDQWDTDAFLAGQADRQVWLFDRTTAMYRGYAVTGDPSPLTSAYREAAIYRAGVTGTGSATRIGVPSAADDLKYHYSQGMALHYLLTGDDRFREAAENVAVRAHDLWTDPGYAGGTDFWTERHAGFALLSYEWAAQVTDDRLSTFHGWATEAVDAYVAMQENSRASMGGDSNARCFAHSAEAHDEDYGTMGCSPWMSAIVADGLEAHALRVGGSRASMVREHIVMLGRAVALRGRGAGGRPYYWMAVSGSGVEDEYDEHWGESAYLVAMAWHYSGRSDSALRSAADALVNGLRDNGEAGQVRSFNWQCRSAVQAPAYLQ